MSQTVVRLGYSTGLRVVIEHMAQVRRVVYRWRCMGHGDG